ncbi:MAG: hypothetical protein JWQ02_2075 [Capsulimonas sp.]|nr:hypothetical protein [Capsulimonas sp.]
MAIPIVKVVISGWRQLIVQIYVVKQDADLRDGPFPCKRGGVLKGVK